jgi:membrane protease YdiL (CAAX protease family)
MRESDQGSTSSDRTELWGLAFALCFPSVLTWAYFVALGETQTSVQQATYAIGKLIQFAFPLCFLTFVVREPIRFRWRWRSGLLEGALSGVLILGAIVAAWLTIERSQAPLIAVLMSSVSAKVVGLGVAAPWRYLGLAAFYSIVHSLLEEYYWRWFVFSRLRRRTKRVLAIVLSSVGFMAHHTILMGVFAGWTSPYTYLFSLTVAIGGAYWAWLYERRGTIVAPWLSHLFVDVAIFAVGYALLRP